MSSVSTIGQQQQLNALLADLRRDLFEAQNQVSTGRRAEDFSGLGQQPTLQSISLRAELGRLDQYRAVIDTVQPRLGVMDKALVGLTDAARTGYTSLLSISRIGTPPTAIINDTASLSLDQVFNRLNTELSGRHVFAATDVTNNPIADTSAARTEAQSLIAAYLAGTQTGSQVLTNMNALSEAQLGYSAEISAGTTGSLEVLIDDDLKVDYTVRAETAGAQDIIRGLALLAEIDYDPAQSDDYWTIFDGAMALVESGADALDIEIGQLGTLRAQFTDVRAGHDQTEIAVKDGISAAEDVDAAEAITRLQNIQIQLEASYQTLAQLRNLSLVNYL